MTVDGTFDYDPEDDEESRSVARVTVLGVEDAPNGATLQQGDDSSDGQVAYNSDSQSVEITFEQPIELDESFTLSL